MEFYSIFRLGPGAGCIVFRATPYIEWKWLWPKFKVRVDWGVSLCSPADDWNQEYGLDLASWRLQDHSEGYKIKGQVKSGTFYVKHKEWNQLLFENNHVEACCDVVFGNDLVETPWSWHRYVH